MMMSVEQSVEFLAEKTEVLGEAPRCPPQIPHDLTRATAVGNQRLTA
jgi:hypothetical protein